MDNEEIDRLRKLLKEKDQEIYELRSRPMPQPIITSAPPPPPPDVDLSEWENAVRIRDEEIARLKARNIPQEFDDSEYIKAIKDRDYEIRRLREELSKKAQVEIIRKSPKIERIPEPITKIQYEKDPVLIEENKRLAKELEIAVEEEQNAKRELKEALEEIEKLHRIIAELKARPPKIIEKEKIVVKKVDKPVRIGNRLEKLMDMYKKKWDRLNKRLAQDVLYYYRLAKHFQRLSKQTKERVFINQKLEVVDGTWDIWNFMRLSLVDWLFEVFVRSVEASSKKKT